MSNNKKTNNSNNTKNKEEVHKRKQLVELKKEDQQELEPLKEQKDIIKNENNIIVDDDDENQEDKKYHNENNNELKNKQNVDDIHNNNNTNTNHVYLQPKLTGHKYNEFPITSIFLHITLAFLLAILFFVDYSKGLIWVCVFFYIGIQAESVFGDIPIVFKISKQVDQIQLGLKKMHERWIKIEYDVSSYHYKQRQVHGQKRRGKVYTAYKATQLNYITCEDVSEECKELLNQNNNSNHIVVVNTQLVYSYGNDKIKEQFNQQIQEAIDFGQKADKFVDTQINISLIGNNSNGNKNDSADDCNDLQEFVYNRNSSIFVNKFFFWFTSLLLLTVPYRLFVNSKTARLTYKIHKKIYA